MSTITIPTRVPGIIQPEWANDIRDALTTDFVPRGTSGVPTDLAGGLGDSTRRWTQAYLQEILLYQSTKRIKIKPPATITNDYDLTLPAALPGTNRPLIVSPSGIVSFGQIETQMIADGAVTQVKRGSAYFVKSSSSTGAFSTGYTSGNYTDITNATLTLVSTGKPVLLVLIPFDTSAAYVELSNPANAAAQTCDLQFLIDGATSSYAAQTRTGSGSSAQVVKFPPSSMMVMHTGLSAGSHTIKAQVRINENNGASILFQNCGFLALELF